MTPSGLPVKISMIFQLGHFNAWCRDRVQVDDNA